LAGRGVTLSALLSSAQEQLKRLAADLDVLRLQMLGIQSSLPEHPAESSPLVDLETMDPATELRTVIDCVINDYIGPAIRDLRDAVAETAEQHFDGASTD
jgi:hypothetical protein